MHTLGLALLILVGMAAWLLFAHHDSKCRTIDGTARTSTTVDRRNAALYLTVALACSAIAGPTMWMGVMRDATVPRAVDLQVQPPDAPLYDFRIEGKHFRVTHPGGHVSTDEFFVPLDQPVHVLITADEDCTLTIPAMRVTRHLHAGAANTLWFEATKLGTYRLALSGAPPATAFVHGTVHVLTAERLAEQLR